MARKGLKKGSCSKLMMILMVICVLLSLTTLVIVSYDKLVKTNEPAIANK